MDNWLVYWKTYWEDVNDPRNLDAHLHSSYEPFYRQIEPGDVIWVVVSGGTGNKAQWRLLEHFCVIRKRTLDETTVGWKYRFEGDADSHEVFDPGGPIDVSDALTSLDFASDRPIPYKGKQIGRALQHPRKLAVSDVEVLRRYAVSQRPVQRGVPSRQAT